MRISKIVRKLCSKGSRKVAEPAEAKAGLTSALTAPTRGHLASTFKLLISLKFPLFVTWTLAIVSIRVVLMKD